MDTHHIPAPYPKTPAYRGEADLLHAVHHVVCMEKLDGANLRVRVSPNAHDAREIAVGGRALMEGEPGFAQAGLPALIRDVPGRAAALLALAASLDAPLELYGEVCGGKVQRMGHVYGPRAHVVLFAARVGGVWLSPTRSTTPSLPTLQQVAARLELPHAPILYEGPPDAEVFQALQIQPSAHGRAVGVQRDDALMAHEGIVIWADPLLCGPDGLPLRAKLKHPTRREYTAPHDAASQTPEGFATRAVTPERLRHARQHLEERGRWPTTLEAPPIDALVRRVVQDVAREVAEYQDMLRRHGKRPTRAAIEARARALADEG